MKAKLLFLLAGLALSGFVMNGCYTQIARPDREDETTVSREEEYTEEETEEAQVSDTRRDDIRHHTDVYVYGGSWYDPWYYPWYSSWYRYPRSRFYFSVGFGYDPWGWCGTAWDWWSDPWCGAGYYSPYWGRGWSPAYYYDPHYRHYPYYGTRDRIVENKKRPITRRGLKPGSGSDQSAGTYVSGGGGGSLLRPTSGIYTRGTDGTYRRVRKGEATSGRTITDDQNSARPTRGSREIIKRGSRDAGGIKRAAATPQKNSSGNNQGSVRRIRKPASSSGDSYNRPTRPSSSSRGSSGSGGSVSKPSRGGSSGGASAPRSSGKSSSGGSSSKRPSRNNK